MTLFSKDTLRIDAPFALVALAATLGAAALAAAPYLLDRGPSHARQQEIINERRTIAADSERDLAKYQATVETLTARSADAVKLRPATAVIPRVVEITALAAECSASISQIAPQPALPPAPVAPGVRDKAVVVPIKLSGTATYENATQFLRLLRTRFRDTAVTGIRIAAAPSDTSPDATYAFDLAWYTAPANSAVSADPAAKVP